LKNLKELSERRAAAAQAKEQLLKKFGAAPKSSDPDMVDRRAKRVAVAAAREARRAERERSVQENLARQTAEAEAIARAASAEADAREADARNRIARVLTDEAERKAERDRRYAARKAKQR
jgi:hypothetical protein